MIRTVATVALALVSIGAMAQQADVRKDLVGTWKGDGIALEVTDRGIVRSENSPDGSVIDPTAPANFAFSYVRDGAITVTCKYVVDFLSTNRSVWRGVENDPDQACPAEGFFKRGEG